MSRPSRLSHEQRARAVRMVLDGQSGYPSQWAAIESVAAKVGVSAEKLHKWGRQAEVDGGQRPGLTGDDAAEVKRLRREVAEPRRANDPQSSCGFLRGRARPATAVLVSFIEQSKNRTDGGRRWRVESICRVL